jgi:hypothetical protein
MPSTTTILSLLSLALTTYAKTDLSGCTSSNTVAFGGASVLWYVPGTGEICAPLDCGGGRAPPKTTVPGCAAYSGTATYSPSFIAGYGIATAASSWKSEATAIGTWTSEASALSTETGKWSSTTEKATTTAKATLSTAVAMGTGAITYDTSAVNGTTLAHTATPTAAATSSSSSSAPSSEAGVVRLGRGAMLMVVGAVVGVALL